MNYGKIIVLKNVNGETIVNVISLKKELNLEVMYKYANCDTIDIREIRLKNIGFRVSLIFDDEFLLKESPVPNKIASLLYGYASEHTDVICGDVIIAKDIETDDGLKSVGMKNDEVSKIMRVIEQCQRIQYFVRFRVQEPSYEICFKGE